MAIIRPNVVLDVLSRKQNDEVICMLQLIITELKQKIKKLEAIISLCKHNDSMNQGYSILLEEINNEMASEVKR